MVDFSDWKRKLYAVLAVLVIFTIVLYPLWPLKMRQGVYYLSWGFLILLGLFFVMAIFRVILFCITYFVTPPGLWLFPNLWEDVSFLDSFKPVWAWHEVMHCASMPLLPGIRGAG
jgi:translocation protein SEC62